MAKRNYLCIEEPDNEATIDFLGKHGCVIKASLEKKNYGATKLYIIVTACDDRATILGEIFADVPEADDGK